MRYEKVQLSAGDSPSDENTTADWEKCKRDFKETTLFDKQGSVSMEIERRISQLVGVSGLKSPGIAKLISAERRRMESQRDFIGWFTVVALRLKLPNIYDPKAIDQ